MKPLSLRSYARHRRENDLPGGTHSAVHKAIREGRLIESLTADFKIADVALADQEWRDNTREWRHIGWWQILARNITVAARKTLRDRRELNATEYRRANREQRKAAGKCANCSLPAENGTLCPRHAEQNRENAAKLARARREERERRLAGMVLARDVARELGCGEERICEWARESLIPFKTQGAKGGRRWFDLDEVKAAIGELNVINGVVYRPGSRRGSSVALRESERTAELHTCATCAERLPACDFPTSALRRGVYICRKCRRDAHAVERQLLSDGYVKDLLTKKTGLRAANLPSALVEVHRAHLMVSRLIKDREKSE